MANLVANIVAKSFPSGFAAFASFQIKNYLFYLKGLKAHACDYQLNLNEMDLATKLATMLATT